MAARRGCAIGQPLANRSHSFASYSAARTTIALSMVAWHTNHLLCPSPQIFPLFTAPALAATEEPLDFIIQFSPNERQLYGFDAKNQTAFNNYEKVQLQNEKYPITWKSIEAGRFDYVNATVAGKTDFPGFIGFKTPTMVLASQATDKEAKKTLRKYYPLKFHLRVVVMLAPKSTEVTYIPKQ